MTSWAQENGHEQVVMTEWVSVDGRPWQPHEVPPQDVPFEAARGAVVESPAKDGGTGRVLLVVEHNLYT
ncbi:MAG TPA: hypothetical protein PK468_16130, partial [Candidatus Hydrogenedentes bacterium]|nr:hypothetical protein [Candidatus Hydrogenedentota bacterium]